MIDPHVHLRDWNQKDKETVEHGLRVAYDAGLSALFEMPNTDPAITSMKTIKERIQLADDAIARLGITIFHGLYAGVTADSEQIKEIVQAHKELFPRVVGLKLYAGHSTGDMGMTTMEMQQNIYKTLAELDYKGVLAVHCEKEALIMPELWEPEEPITHTLARPAVAEVESVRDQIMFAKGAGFKGTLHICHISTPEAIDIIEQNRPKVKFKITCGVTPHHCVLFDEMMENNILLKVNPPLRSRGTEELMLDALKAGRIDWIETDHAPHTLKDKIEKHASGFPGLPNYPRFIRFLREEAKMDEETIKKLTHDNIVKAYGIEIENQILNSSSNLDSEYEFSAFK